MKTEFARRNSASYRRVKRIPLGPACALAVGLGIIGSAPASAQFYQLLSPSYQQSHRVKHKALRKHGVEQQASKLPFGDIPKGPLEIFVSIDQQKLYFYSNGALVASEPVATGVPGHLTPLGVFSVIQRDRYHHSNLYSNAPMPYMERITWSGVALHEGPGVGHQASHGCIRMPHSFAARLWMLPTMGMRVIIARPELRPISFADSHLFVRKELPPTAALPGSVQTAQQVAPGTKSDAALRTAAAAGAPSADTAQSAQLDLRLSPAPAAAATPTPSAADKPAAQDAAAPAAPAKPASADPKTAQAPVPANPAGQAGSAPAATATSPAADTKTPGVAAEPVASPLAPAAAATTPQPVPATPSKDGGTAASTPSTPPASASSVPGAAANAPAAADMTAPIAIEDVPIPLTKPARIEEGRNKPIAVFVSRKTSRIYVRQDFMPLFDAPVTIDHPEQPLGTHVYTALDYLPDHSTFRWTVTTVPTATGMRKVERWKYVRDQWGRRRRVRVEERIADPESAQPAATPAEALGRIQIPQDVICQISQLMVPGSSLVVSDQGLGSETGDHTDFIVVTR